MGQRHNITRNNFLLQVPNHALEKFLINVLIDLTNYGIHCLFNNSLISCLFLFKRTEVETL